MRNLLALVVLLAAGGCSTAIALTDSGAQVRHLQDVDLPLGCRVLSDVSIGTPPDAARPRNEDDLIILMRNAVATHGGNVLAVDDTDQREDAGATYFVGRGRAYTCPEETSGSSTPAEGDTGLPPEETEDEESADDEEPVPG